MQFRRPTSSSKADTSSESETAGRLGDPQSAPLGLGDERASEQEVKLHCTVAQEQLVAKYLVFRYGQLHVKYVSLWLELQMTCRVVAYSVDEADVVQHQSLKTE